MIKILFYEFFTIFIASCWLITASFILIFSWFLKNKDYVIKTRKQLWKTWGVFPFLLLLLCYIFSLRILRQDFIFNIPVTANKVFDMVSSIYPTDLIIFILFGILAFLFFLIASKTFYGKVKKSAHILFVYYYQYQQFRDFCHFIHRLESDFSWFFLYFALKYTKKPFILGIVRGIWPISIEIIERNVFFGILPYLILYDYVAQFGVITKVFYVMPWYYIYSLIRTTIIVFNNLAQEKNTNITFTLYGFKK